MSGPDAFQIQVQGPAVYYEGQTIQGQVFISNRELLSNIKNIQIKLSGLGNVLWTERKPKTRKSSDGQRDEHYYETVKYENHEEYISNKCLLHQGPLGAGKHNFSFSFVLPPKLPCSFEGQYGYVRYFIEAKLCRSGFFTFDKRQKQFITINSICDLNSTPGAEKPQTNSNTKTFGALFWKSEPLSTTLTIPRYGYTSGENIPISAIIENQSNKKMNQTKAVLFQNVTFRATNGTKDTKILIREIKKNGQIGAHSFDSWEGKSMRIPAIPPSGLGGCRIIDISYRLEFVVVPSGIGYDLSVSVPIMIGNIPLKNTFQSILPDPPKNLSPDIIEWPDDQQESSNSNQNAGAAALPPPYMNYDPIASTAVQSIQGPSAPPIPMSEYFDLPPPSYEDAISAYEDGMPNQLRSDRDTTETDANWDFTPKYPVWSMPSISSD